MRNGSAAFLGRPLVNFAVHLNKGPDIAHPQELVVLVREREDFHRTLVAAPFVLPPVAVPLADEKDRDEAARPAL